METIQLRFPTLAKNILNNLEDQSLLKYQESSKENYDFLKSEKFYWMRIIIKYDKYFETSNESWKKTILKTNAEVSNDRQNRILMNLKNEHRSLQPAVHSTSVSRQTRNGS